MKSTPLTILLLVSLHLRLTQGQSCLSGFLSEAEVVQEAQSCSDNSCGRINNDAAIVRLIPEMNFTCSGTITKWRAAGQLSSQISNNDTKLRVWRKVANQSVIYSSTQLTIALGICPSGQNLNIVGTNVYECVLASNLQISVQAGDIVGLEVPHSSRRDFEPYLKKRTGPRNYEFSLTSNSGVVNVSLTDTNIITRRDQPLLSLMVIEIDTTVTTSNSDRRVTTNNNVTTVDSDNGNSAVLSISVMTVSIIAGLALMFAIIIVLILALVCSVRKNRRLKKKMIKTERARGLSVGDSGNFNSSMEMILDESTTAINRATSIPMEENIAYKKQRGSDGYEYVINELVYASVENPHQHTVIPPTSNGYLDLQA